MPNNYLVTGPPRSGKTTVVERVAEHLRDAGYELGGVYSPELREDSDRVGFEIRDVLTGDSRTLAHVDRESGPTVGKYRVNVEGLDELSEAAFRRALADADAILVDEIAPMEVYSDTFVDGVRRALDDDRPLVAAVHYRSESGFVGEVKSRTDVEVFEVTPETRDGLPATIADRILA